MHRLLPLVVTLAVLLLVRPAAAQSLREALKDIETAPHWAKTGPEPDYQVPEQTPGLTDRPAKTTAKQTCIHCHMVKEFALRARFKVDLSHGNFEH